VCQRLFRVWAIQATLRMLVEFTQWQALAARVHRAGSQQAAAPKTQALNL